MEEKHWISDVAGGHLAALALASVAAALYENARESKRGRAHLLPVLASPGMDDQEDVHPAIRALRTVCRCNNVKYKTLERAIREGAHTLTQVANRTTATMGECGGSCTPEVQKLIEELAPKYATAAAKPAAANANADAWWVRKK